MKNLKLAFMSLAILAGVGGAFASNAAKRFATYYVIADGGSTWKVQTAAVSCPGGSLPCRIQSNTAPDANSEIPKDEVTVETLRGSF